MNKNNFRKFWEKKRDKTSDNLNRLFSGYKKHLWQTFFLNELFVPKSLNNWNRLLSFTKFILLHKNFSWISSIKNSVDGLQLVKRHSTVKTWIMFWASEYHKLLLVFIFIVFSNSLSSKIFVSMSSISATIQYFCIPKREFSRTNDRFAF